MPQQKHKKASVLLQELANNKSLKEQISLREIITSLKESSFGIVLLIFALPSALPFSGIPGVGFALSVPLVILGLQMAIGYKKVQLPTFITKLKISHEKFSALVRKTKPYLELLQKPLKPRLSFMMTTIPTCITGIFITLLAILVIIPIPLTNPFFAFFIVVYALALTEKDGLVILINWIINAIMILLLVLLVRHFF